MTRRSRGNSLAGRSDRPGESRGPKYAHEVDPDAPAPWSPPDWNSLPHRTPAECEAKRLRRITATIRRAEKRQKALMTSAPPLGSSGRLPDARRERSNREITFWASGNGRSGKQFTPRTWVPAADPLPSRAGADAWPRLRPARSATPVHCVARKCVACSNADRED